MFINCVCIGCKLTSVCQTRRRGAKRLRESVRSFVAAGLFFVMLTFAFVLSVSTGPACDACAIADQYVFSADI